MNKIILYHGSPEIIEKPDITKGKMNNDCGQGFYCTQDLERAREWACLASTDGYANCYELDMDGLRVLNLSLEEYTILHWMALLVTYRHFHISSPVMKRGKEWLQKNFLIDISEYDVIIGYRADDSYFSFARAFLNNEISVKQLSYALKLGQLGEQVVLKSEKAFRTIRYVSYEAVDSSVYYLQRRTRDTAARQAYNEELEKEEPDGMFIRDLMREGVMSDDVRIR